MVAELEPHSSVEAFLEEVPEGEPRCWVRVTRPGMNGPEEVRYQDLMGKPAVIAEDRAIMQEASRQQRALVRDWKARAAEAERVPPFEIIRVVSDRSPLADGFDPLKHMTIYYRLDGREHQDVPSSLDRMIRASPEQFPHDATTLIRAAVGEKLTSLREQCAIKPDSPPVEPVNAEEAQDIKEELDSPSMPALEDYLAIEEESQSIQSDVTIAPLTRQDRPHPDSLEGAMERLEFTRRCKEEDKNATVAPRHAFKIIDTRKDAANGLFITAEIDGERKEWRYDDLEAEVGDNLEYYPPLTLDALQEEKARQTTQKDARGKEQSKSNNSALRLVEMAKQGGGAHYFHDLARVPYACIERDGHCEVRAVREYEFAEWLTELNYAAEGLAPDEAAAKRAIATLSFLAGRGEEHPVYLRHGEHEGAFYYDLCNEQRQAVRITPDGWSVVDNPPVMFRRYDHMRPQAIPIRPEGEHWAMKELVSLANIGRVGREVLEVQLHVLMVPGIEQMGGGTLGLEGTGKTTTQRLAVAIGDPSTDVESGLPKNKNDLTLHLSTHSLASFDNLTHISEEQSDDLSRSNTGATETQRELYTNNGTNRRRYRTPSFFNGINISGAKPDFYDRNIIYRTLETFDGPRLSNKKVLAKIDELLPFALGEIFDNLSRAMNLREQFTEDGRWTPRMVDWYLWALAFSKAMGRPDGWFEGVFRPMIQQRDYDAIADHPLTRALEFVAGQNGYVGIANEVFAHLNDRDLNIPFSCQVDTRDRKWPTSAGSLGMRIKPLIKSLRSHGVYIYKRQWSNLKRYRNVLSDLDWARVGNRDDLYRDSDDVYIISSKELDVGRDDETAVGGK
jgi:hypothetical protein